jgi:phosphoribosyl 1,2-cyclic phosphodiesterase
MKLRVVSLASCSKYGNTYLISHRGSSIMVDCGLTLRRLENSLHELGVSPKSLDGVLVSHEHTDHIRALQLKNPFAGRHGLRVFAPRVFWRAAREIEALPHDLRCSIEDGESLSTSAFKVMAFGKPHDSASSVGYKVVSDDGCSVVVITDLGEVTPAVVRAARDADYIILESNHDVRMEQRSGRPYALIARVLGSRGHLSNEQAGEALELMVTPRTRGVMLAHLSLDCNTPKLAVDTVAPYLRRARFSGCLIAAQPEGITTLSDTLLDEQESIF